MKAPRRKDDEVAFMLAPMIDMTFLLLIFFMVTTRITEEQKAIKVDLPLAMAAIKQENLRGREIISISKEGQAYIGKEPISTKELGRHLQKRLKEQPPLRVYIRADANLKAKHVKKVMELCAKAGAIDVIFGSYQP